MKKLNRNSKFVLGQMNTLTCNCFRLGHFKRFSKQTKAKEIFKQKKLSCTKKPPRHSHCQSAAVKRFDFCKKRSTQLSESDINLQNVSVLSISIFDQKEFQQKNFPFLQFMNICMFYTRFW